MKALAGPIPVRQIIDDVHRMDEATFVASYGPTLLVGIRSGPHVEARESEDDELWSFGTRNVEVPGDDGPLANIVDFDAGEAYPLRKVHTQFFPKTILIGRAFSNDLCIDDPSVSKLHARIRIADDGLTLVEDADSRNGTFVNGQPATSERVVRDGDVVTFGRRRFRFFVATNLRSFLRRVPGR